MIMLSILPNYTYPQRNDFQDLEEIKFDTRDEIMMEEFENKINIKGQMINIFTSKYFIYFLVPFIFPFIVYILYFFSFTKFRLRFNIIANLSILMIILFILYIQYSLRYSIQILHERNYIYRTFYDDTFNIKYYQEDEESSKMSGYLINKSDQGSMENITILTYITDIFLLLYLTVVSILLLLGIDIRRRQGFSAINERKPLKYFLNIKNLVSKFN